MLLALLDEFGIALLDCLWNSVFEIESSNFKRRTTEFEHAKATLRGGLLFPKKIYKFCSLLPEARQNRFFAIGECL